ncbi:sensor histidine kinase [Dysgonomonas sp. 25]|nr:sensor histidine kinase [Dysgonomonas sp. 25]
MAIVIAFGSLIISNMLVGDLSEEERNKMTIWAEATKDLASNSEGSSMELIFLILNSNKTIPVIHYDKKTDHFDSANIDLPAEGQQDFLRKEAMKFSKKHEPIIIEAEDFEQFVYYDDSYTLKRLQAFPYIQLGVMFVFVATSFLALLTTKRAEQDRLWVGLTKETAHQLGTPISSLIAWVEYLRMKEVDADITDNMEKDIDRLQIITDRFSKVGSEATLEKKDIADAIHRIVNYLSVRISKKVTFTFNFPDQPLYANINEILFSWVIENLTKNAVDAMSGQGGISYTIFEKNQIIYIDIEDSGKGIPKSKFKDIFSPGFTTKTRGWGLGLSLAKRIIEKYHKGKIYVKSSDINVGTIFRIELKRTE